MAMKKVRRSICLFLASCMIMSLLCFTASAESGTYNNRTYTISLTLDQDYITSQISYPTSIQLGFLGYGEASLGSAHSKTPCANNGTAKRIAKTVNPNRPQLFYHAYQEYYCQSHLVKTVQRNITRQ